MFPFPPDGPQGGILTKTVPQDLFDPAVETAWVDKGLPEGGTTGQALVKRSNTDFDTEWMPNAPFFYALASPQFSYNGTDPVGTIIGNFTISGAQLPATPFSWIAEGYGPGAFFSSNRGAPVTGTPNSSFDLELWDGTEFVKVATASYHAGQPFPVPNMIVRLSQYSPNCNRVFQYDPAVLNEIRFRMRLTFIETSGTGPFTMNLGLQGMIISFP